MPRKRAVKKVRCVPEVPLGDEGKDLTKDEQQQKLHVFLADFDRKFEEKKQGMQHKIDLTLKRIDTYCQMGIQQIPKSLRKMKLVDFIAAGGTFESALEYMARKDDPYADENVDSLKTTGKGDAPADNQLYSDPIYQKIAADCASAIEQVEQIQISSCKKPLRTQTNTYCQSAVKKPLTQIQEMTDVDIDGMVTQTLRATRHTSKTSSMKPPPSTARKKETVREKTKGSRLRPGSRMMQTPIGSQRTFGNNWMTPAITPKFDPRLPMTPFDRSPKYGERMMSLAGSPLVQTRRADKLTKIRETISSALISEGLDTHSIEILNSILEMTKE